MAESRPGEEWDGARYQREKRSFIERRMALRSISLHAALIFTGTALAGWAASFLLLHAGVAAMPTRYALAFGIAYVAFLACVRIWADSMRREEANRGDGGWDLPTVDAEGCLVALGVFLVCLLLAGVFTWLGGASLLLEVAFEVVFAGVVVKRLGRRDRIGDWAGRLLRGTWLPALLAGLVLVGFAGWLQHEVPQARTLPQAVKVLRR